MIEAAIVRIKEDKEPVGIFVYDGKFRDDLYWLVDECTDPGSCEYKKIQRGGVYFPSNFKINEEDEIMEAQFTESLFLVCERDKTKWRDVERD
jgi:hypothetical protein|tara:strand:- start:184 stop:462 length:279 start_codon:yes stop_codon:yes gene_type:complete